MNSQEIQLTWKRRTSSIIWPRKRQTWKIWERKQQIALLELLPRFPILRLLWCTAAPSEQPSPRVRSPQVRRARARSGSGPLRAAPRTPAPRRWWSRPAPFSVWVFEGFEASSMHDFVFINTDISGPSFTLKRLQSSNCWLEITTSLRNWSLFLFEISTVLNRRPTSAQRLILAVSYPVVLWSLKMLQ